MTQTQKDLLDSAIKQAVADAKRAQIREVVKGFCIGFCVAFTITTFLVRAILYFWN